MMTTYVHIVCLYVVISNRVVRYSKESMLIDDSLLQISRALNIHLRTSVNFVWQACVSIRFTVHVTINVRSFILPCRCTLY
jgi:NMD protein affecting ribosome stability and mRNA decay